MDHAGSSSAPSKWSNTTTAAGAAEIDTIDTQQINNK
jgi:hypothetical protein